MTAIVTTEAHRRLADALLDLPRPLPCTTGEPISDDRQARTNVVEHLCPHCPVLALCYEAGQTETWFVWGGVDKSPDPATRRAAPRRRVTA